VNRIDLADPAEVTNSAESRYGDRGDRGDRGTSLAEPTESATGSEVMAQIGGPGGAGR
jgi:hypothetical protein